MTPIEELSLIEEEKLVNRALNGDGDAFGVIYDTYSPVLHRTVIYPRIRDEKGAEEVLQETFLLALKKLATFEWQNRSIFFWLRMIAINKCREWIASSRRHSTVDEAVLDYQHDTSYQPEAEVVQEDFSGVLRGRTEDVLKGLNERYAKAIRMRLIEKREREECAAELDVSVETFDVVFFRACKSFRKKYINKYGEL